MKNRIVFAVCALITILLCSFSSFAFDNEFTHQQLTRTAIEYCSNKGYFDYFSEKRWIKKIANGSQDEDGLSKCSTRCFCHFDPVLGIPGTVDAKTWAFDDVSAKLCSPNTLGKNRYKWDNVLNTALDPDYRRESLGHVLHLLQDMAVPAHVRRDSHGTITCESNDPLETWAKDNRDSIDELSAPTDDWIVSHLSTSPEKEKSYFNMLKMYTQNNFFSSDTCFESGLPEPEECSGDNNNYFYGLNDDGVCRKVAFKSPKYYLDVKCIGTLCIPTIFNKTKCIIDDVIAEEQFNELYSKAVLYSASLIKEYADRLKNDSVFTNFEVFSAHFESGYYAELSFYDPNKVSTSINVRGPGISGSAKMAYYPEKKSWWLAPNPFLGASIPSSSVSYVFTQNDINIITEKVTGYVADFATDLKPAGGTSGPITFSWKGVDYADSYAIQLYDAAPWQGGTQIWTSSTLDHNTTKKAYDGPNLTSGHTYYYYLLTAVTSKGVDNYSFALESFTME